MFFSKYPNSDFHELNLDWIIDTVKNLLSEFGATLDEIGRFKESVSSDISRIDGTVEDIYDNVRQIVVDNIKNIFGDDVSTAVKEWFDAHPEATTTVVDHSLNYAKLINGTMGYVFPEMFGAVGDGVIDDTASFINAINSGLPIVGLEESIYKINSINLENAASSNLSLNHLKIVYGGTSKTYIFDLSRESSVKQVYFNDVKLNGNSTAIGVFRHDHMPNLTSAEFENVEVKNMSSLLDDYEYALSYALFAAADIIKYSNCYVHDNEGHGIMFRSHITDGNENANIIVSDCVAIRNGVNHWGIGIGSYSDLIGITASNDNNATVSIMNCISKNNGASGIAPHGIAYVNVSGNVSSDNGEHGIVIQQSRMAVVSSNTCLKNHSYGVRVQGNNRLSDIYVRNVLIESNRIEGFNNGTGGIKVGIKSTEVVCKGNLITNVSYPFNTETSEGHNNVGSNDVSFIHNIVDCPSEESYFPTDMFNNYCISSNVDKFGKNIPNGMLTVKDSNVKIYFSSKDTSENVSPINVKDKLTDITVDGAEFVGNTLSVTKDFTSGQWLCGYRYSVDNKTVTFCIKCPSGVIPQFILRNGSYSSLGTYQAIKYVALNGTMSEYTVTLICSDDVAVIDCRLYTVQPLAVGNHSAYIKMCDGMRMNK